MADKLMEERGKFRRVSACAGKTWERANERDSLWDSTWQQHHVTVSTIAQSFEGMKYPLEAASLSQGVGEEGKFFISHLVRSLLLREETNFGRRPRESGAFRWDWESIRRAEVWKGKRNSVTSAPLAGAGGEKNQQKKGTLTSNLNLSIW